MNEVIGWCLSAVAALALVLALAAATVWVITSIS